LPISSDIGIEVEEIKANAKEFFKLDPRLEDVRFELVPKRFFKLKKICKFFINKEKLKNLISSNKYNFFLFSESQKQNSGKIMPINYL